MTSLMTEVVFTRTPEMPHAPVIMRPIGRLPFSVDEPCYFCNVQVCRVLLISIGNHFELIV